MSKCQNAKLGYCAATHTIPPPKGALVRRSETICTCEIVSLSAACKRGTILRHSCGRMRPVLALEGGRLHKLGKELPVSVVQISEMETVSTLSGVSQNSSGTSMTRVRFMGKFPLGTQLPWPLLLRLSGDHDVLVAIKGEKRLAGCQRGSHWWWNCRHEMDLECRSNPCSSHFSTRSCGTGDIDRVRSSLPPARRGLSGNLTAMQCYIMARE